MSSLGDAPVGGMVFGFVIVALLFWIGVSFLPFAAPVAAWFRRRMESDPVLPPLGRSAAARNMTPGQIVLFSVASLVVTTVIMFNVVPKLVSSASESGASGLAVVGLIFLGAAGLVGGVVVVLRLRGTRRGALATGVVVSIFGMTAAILGIAMALTAGG